MEAPFYNILWIDDEHETLGGTKGRAKRNGINLIPFKSLNGGMSELERNYPNYDGVLLDAKFFENEDDVKNSEDTDYVHRAKERLLQLKKKFEVFVLTGQAEAYEDKTFAKAFPKVFKKGSDEEIGRLFTEIKIAASSQEDTQLRHSYKRVFDVCTEKYIGEYAGQDILFLLKINNESEVDKNLSTIRDIVQDLFAAFHKFNLLPAEFVTPAPALNESSKFLAGKNFEGNYFEEKGYRHLDSTHLPKQIVSYIKDILRITQPGSHRSEIDDHIRTVRTHFLMKSLLFQIFDVLVWFKIYVDSNPKTQNWERINKEDKDVESGKEELIHGKVVSINPVKGFAFFKPNTLGDDVLIPSHLVSFHSLKKDMKIQVEIEQYIHNRTGETNNRVKNIKML
jgi:cold shock CspA family protein